MDDADPRDVVPQTTTKEQEMPYRFQTKDGLYGIVTDKGNETYYVCHPGFDRFCTAEYFTDRFIINGGLVWLDPGFPWQKENDEVKTEKPELTKDCGRCGYSRAWHDNNCCPNSGGQTYRERPTAEMLVGFMKKKDPYLVRHYETQWRIEAGHEQRKEVKEQC